MEKIEKPQPARLAQLVALSGLKYVTSRYGTRPRPKRYAYRSASLPQFIMVTFILKQCKPAHFGFIPHDCMRSSTFHVVWRAVQSLASLLNACLRSSGLDAYITIAPYLRIHLSGWVAYYSHSVFVPFTVYALEIPALGGRMRTQWSKEGGELFSFK
jgi:hypothetical protein